MKNKFRNSDSAVKAGDVLLTEEPFTSVLSSKEKGNRCDYCFTKGKVLKCSGCQFVHYCGRSCQKDAWTEHKWECNNLKRITPKVIPDAARILSKIVNKLNRGDGNSYRAFYSSKSFRMWKDLMSHYSDLKADKKRMDHFTTLCMVLYEFLKDSSLPNTVELLGLYGRMVINSFTILDTDMNSIGTGIYLACSIIDHSCEPNAVATFDGRLISIRAIKDMPHLDWNQIRISYIDLMKTPYERQTELLQSYYFLCQCDRCLDASQLRYIYGANCPNSECNNPISVEWKENIQLKIEGNKKEHTEDIIGNANYQNYSNSTSQNCIIDEMKEYTPHCEECGYKLTEKQVEVFKKAMEFTELHLQNMKGASVAYVDVCKYCLERQEGVLHPLNVMRAQTLDHAFDALIEVQLWEQACKYAIQLIPCFRFYYGECHPLLGLLHLKYGKILLYKMELNKALNEFKAAEKVLKITHGNEHPLYREELLPLLKQATLESV